MKENKHCIESLPENANKLLSLDIDNDQKLSVRTNMMSLMLLMPFAMVLLVLFINGASVSFDLGPLEWSVFIGGIVVSMVLHELVHALFFFIYSHAKVKIGTSMLMIYSGVEDRYFTRKTYITVRLMPLFIMNVILAALLVFVWTLGQPTLFYAMYMLTAIHFAGCASDFAIIGEVRKLPKDALVKDDGKIIEGYVKMIYA